MIRSIAMFAMAALFVGAASAKGGGGYIVVVPGVAAAQPGDACIADGIASGQETKTSDGTPVLAKGVHGANTTRCPNPAFPNLATTEKLASDGVRNAPSTQCVSPTAKIGDEVTISLYGLARVIALQPENNECRNGVAATVIGAAAYRSSQTKDTYASQPTGEPTETEIRAEYDRVLAIATPVKEFHVRHILLRTRDEAESAIQQIKSGKPFAEVAAQMSTDPGSSSKGGDLGWNVPTTFIEEFSKTMVNLAPAGLAPEPTRTQFGWHVIELLETKMGKNSFPEYPLVRNRIAAKLKNDRRANIPVAAKAVCRKMVSPETPAAALKDGTKGTVIAEMRVENGRVSKVLNLSGPSIFHPAVIEAVNKYECDQLDRAVIATQSFDF